MSSGPGFRCSGLILEKTPVAATEWTTKKPTYETPVAPEKGKQATELHEWVCYHGRPCSWCVYVESLNGFYCRKNPNSDSSIGYGWTLYYLDPDTSCDGVISGGPGGPGGPRDGGGEPVLE